MKIPILLIRHGYSEYNNAQFLAKGKDALKDQNIESFEIKFG